MKWYKFVLYDFALLLFTFTDILAVEVNGSIRLINQTYLSNYSQPSSLEFQQLQREFCEIVSYSHFTSIEHQQISIETVNFEDSCKLN